MKDSGSAGWFEALIDGGPALLAAIMGATLIVVALIFAFRLKDTASTELTRGNNGHLPAGFEDAWWALRHAAYFCLAVMALGVLLLLGPALGSLGDESSDSPASSADAAATDDEKPDKADKADKPSNRGNRGGNDDEDSDNGSESGPPSPSPSGS